MALNFDGIDQHLILASLLNGATAGTLELWINTTEQGTVQCILVKNDGIVDFCQIFTEATNWICRWRTTTQVRDVIFDTDDALSNGQPHHLAVTWNGTTVTTYVQALLKNTGPLSGTMHTTATRFFLSARDTEPPDLPYCGLAHQIRIWSICRTQPQLLNGLYRRLPAQPGLVGSWPCHEQTGATAYDYSGAHNDGTCVNSPTWLEGYPIPLGAQPLLL